MYFREGEKSIKKEPDIEIRVNNESAAVLEKESLVVRGYSRIKKVLNWKESEPKEKPQNTLHEIGDLFEGLSSREEEAKKARIYNQYAEAMTRRASRTPISEENFEKHFYEGGNHEKSVAFGSDKDGYLLGNELGGIFVPTHFSPSGLKAGVRLLKDLAESDIPAALFIVQDLVDTIKKMDGWRVLPLKGKTKFHGEMVEKIMVINGLDVLPRFAWYLLNNSALSPKKFFNRIRERYISSGGNVEEEVVAENVEVQERYATNTEATRTEETMISRLREGRLDLEDFDDEDEALLQRQISTRRLLRFRSGYDENLEDDDVPVLSRRYYSEDEEETAA